MYGLQVIRDILAPALKARQIWLDWFTYPADWSPLQPNAINVPYLIHFDADSDFLLYEQTIAVFSTPGTPVVAPDYKITMMDTGSGRNFQSGPVHVSNIFGNAQRPYILPEPKLIAAASTLNLQLTNKSTQAAEVNLGFSGVKIFYFSGFSRQQLGLSFGG